VSLLTQRRTVQLSRAQLAAAQERADNERAPLAMVVRRAVARLILAEDRDELLDHALALDESPDAVRRGQRGPMQNCSKQVSYVLDEKDAAKVEALASRVGVSAARLTRAALALELTIAPTVRQVNVRDEHGFITGGTVRDESTRAAFRALEAVKER
jgi:hypothetical protein